MVCTDYLTVRRPCHDSSYIFSRFRKDRDHFFRFSVPPSPVPVLLRVQHHHLVQNGLFHLLRSPAPPCPHPLCSHASCSYPFFPGALLSRGRFPVGSG